MIPLLEGDGANLSQGQRQLINIARAAISKAPILILDEATSSVDTRTEKHIEKGMDRLMAQRTTLVIAHQYCQPSGMPMPSWYWSRARSSNVVTMTHCLHRMAGIMSFIPGRQSWIKLWYHDLNWIKKYAIKEFGAEKHLPIDKVGK